MLAFQGQPDTKLASVQKHMLHAGRIAASSQAQSKGCRVLMLLIAPDRCGKVRGAAPEHLWADSCYGFCGSGIGRTCLPSLMLATAMVILRVTKISPRRGDSWLNRMPLQQNMS